MGDFKYCDGFKAEVPFFHESIGCHIYSMEELCYYLDTNLFLLDTGIIGDPLFRWIDHELKRETLSRQLRECFQSQQDVFSCVALLFEQSECYTAAELAHLKGLLDQMKGKSAMERRKFEGDLLLDAHKYRQAAYYYLELLQSAFTDKMTEELQGNIWHNLGVCYARLYLFEEASSCFATAYHKRKSKASQEAYLYAMNFVPDSYSIEEKEMDLNFAVMRDALNHFTEVQENPELGDARKTAAETASAFNWKARQTKLIRDWSDSFTHMMA